MKGQHAFQASASSAQQTHGRPHIVHRRRQVERAAYTISEICDRISMNRRTFFRLRDQGDLPFLEEVRPRLGRLVRYRADLVEQYVANAFNRA